MRPVVLLRLPVRGGGHGAMPDVDRAQVGGEPIRPARILAFGEYKAGGPPRRPGDQLHDFRYTMAFDRLNTLALACEESLALITGLADAL